MLILYVSPASYSETQPSPQLLLSTGLTESNIIPAVIDFSPARLPKPYHLTNGMVGGYKWLRMNEEQQRLASYLIPTARMPWFRPGT